MKKLANSLEQLGASFPEARNHVLPVLKQAIRDADMFAEELEDDLQDGGMNVTIFQGAGSDTFDLEFARVADDLDAVANQMESALKRSCSRVRRRQSSGEVVLTCEYQGQALEIVLHLYKDQVAGFLDLI